MSEVEVYSEFKGTKCGGVVCRGSAAPDAYDLDWLPSDSRLVCESDYLALQERVKELDRMLDIAWGAMIESDCEGFDFELKAFMESKQ